MAIPSNIVADLAAHLAANVADDRDALVFTGAKGGPLRPHVLAMHWRAATGAVGLVGFHFHDLRHTSNTWAAATGASTRERMARMGHASPVAAIGYQHATAERDRVIADAPAGLAAPPADGEIVPIDGTAR